ncbi:MAG TPA: RtcB family protein, partial [Aggregatilineales bacterium]|nr:RtcB family protein [Aggregatilineales bacterium]
MDTSVIRDEAIPYRIWGAEDIEPGALTQMEHAAQLPIAIKGALMPDANQGYGLPIGGVLATENAVIPYAVGVDIACRMKMTIFDASPHMIGEKRDKFRKIIEESTRFGIGKNTELDHPPPHDVMDDPSWHDLSILREFKTTAWHQIGSSGSGNHFVEFGELIVTEAIQGDGSIEGEGSRTFGNISP